MCLVEKGSGQYLKRGECAEDLISAIIKNKKGEQPKLSSFD